MSLYKKRRKLSKKLVCDVIIMTVENHRPEMQLGNCRHEMERKRSTISFALLNF